MKAFFEVKTIDNVLDMVELFPKTETESSSIEESLNRVLAEDIYSDINIPDFSRSTMDGYAIRASSSFGSSESNPAYLDIKGKVKMGEFPNFCIASGEAAEISTGGAIPDGSDSVIMIEHTNMIDDKSIEIYKSLAPGINVIQKGEDVKKFDITLVTGTKIRPQEMGLIAASGKKHIKVFKKPTVSIISTGNEIIPPKNTPQKGQIRDMNTYTLLGQVLKSGGIPRSYGIIPDNFESLKKVYSRAMEKSDIIIISGGSSMGVKDMTIDVFKSIKNTEILTHGISISPGKPTILAKCGKKQIWGLPGHVASAMIVFKILVQSFLENMGGMLRHNRVVPTIKATLSRNLASSQGRVDYIRVKLVRKGKVLFAEPIIGKSGLISTMTKSDGLVKIGINKEGLYKGLCVSVILF
jgi:molybdopterin molybdotransferase